MVAMVAQTLKHGSMVDLMLRILPQFLKKVKNMLEQPQKTRVLEATGMQRENPKGTGQRAKWNDPWEPQGAGSRRVTKGRSPPLWTSTFPSGTWLKTTSKPSSRGCCEAPGPCSGTRENCARGGAQAWETRRPGTDGSECGGSSGHLSNLPLQGK